jgi:hypothetical protein
MVDRGGIIGRELDGCGIVVNGLLALALTFVLLTVGEMLQRLLGRCVGGWSDRAEGDQATED